MLTTIGGISQGLLSSKSLSLMLILSGGTGGRSHDGESTEMNLLGSGPKMVLVDGLIDSTVLGFVLS